MLPPFLSPLVAVDCGSYPVLAQHAGGHGVVEMLALMMVAIIIAVVVVLLIAGIAFVIFAIVMFWAVRSSIKQAALRREIRQQCGESPFQDR